MPFHRYRLSSAASAAHAFFRVVYTNWASVCSLLRSSAWAVNTYHWSKRALLYGYRGE
jgi:hypothetical protein